MIYSAQNKTVNFNQLSIEVADGGRRTLVVQAYYQNAAGLTDGQVLQLGLDGDTDVSLVPNGTQMSGGNTVVNNGAGTRVAVAATALGLATPPADSRVIDANDEVVSGLEFEVQPLIQARDAAGNTDVDFNGSVSLVLGAVGAGQLSGTKTVGLTDGQAQFTDLAYAAQTDGEAFTLVFSMAGDQARAQLRAPATELADVSVALSADAVATKLIFSTAPAGALSGQPLVVQPVVEAQDARGLTDGEFAGTVELTTAAAGNLVNSVQQAVEGVAAFVDLTYEATADHQAFSLEATAQGDDADLTRALADALDADVLATRLAFTTQPSNGVNRQPLAVTPVVAALDGAGLRDADFTGEVRLGLAEPGGGGEFDPIEGSEGLANPVSTAVAGVAQFPDLRVLRGGTFALAAKVTDGPAGLSQDFTVTNPAPLLESLEPTAVGAGNPDMLLTLQGSQFVEESVVQWNGEDRLTLFIGPDLVQAQIAAADLEEAGSAQIQVVNGPPGGGTSQELSFSITALVQTATVRLLDLDQSFNGAPRAVRVVTAPQRLAVAVTYNGLADPPTRPGSYAVQATITEPGFSGSVSGVLRIAAPPAPTARLVASRTEGPPPLEVTFSDDSQGFISTWFLETRDDEKRIFTNRSEGGRAIYSQPGAYQALLTVEGAGGQAQASLTIVVLNPPQFDLVGDRQVDEDENLVLELGSLVEGDGVWRVEGVDPDLIAQVSIEGNSITFEPVPGQSGSDQVTLIRTNEDGLTSTQAVGLTWRPVDDPAVIAGLPTNFSATEDEPIRVGGRAFVVDEDTDPPAAVWRASGFNAELVASIESGLEGVVFTPVENAVGQTEANIFLSQGEGQPRAEQKVTLTWEGANDPPSLLELVSPADGATDIALSPLLVWRAEDPDGEQLAYHVFFGLPGALQQVAAGQTENTFGVKDLDPDTAYQWRVVGRDAAGEQIAGSAQFTTRADREPPVLSNLRVVPAVGGGTVRWRSSEPATSAVNFAPRDRAAGQGLTQRLASDDLVRDHSIEISGQEGGTWYDFAATSADAQGNVSAPVGGDFLTLSQPDLIAPTVLLGPVEQDVAQDRVTLFVRADEAVRITVFLAPAGTPPQQGRRIDIDAFAEQRLVLVEGLDSSTAYDYFFILEDGSGNSTQTPVQTVSTTDEIDSRPANLVEGPTVRAEDTSVIVGFIADEAVTAQLSLSLKVDSSDRILVVADELSISQQLAADGLVPGSLYYYSLEFTDASGNARTRQGTFNTRDEADVEGPVLEAAAFEEVTDQSATLTLITDELARFRLLISPNGDLSDPTVREAADFRQRRSLVVTNLTAATEYFYTLVVTDRSGNSTPTGGSITTDDEPDITPPSIGVAAVEGVGTDRATLVLAADELTTVAVGLGTTAAADEESFVSTDLAIEHRIPLTGLEPDTRYYLSGVATDGQGNTSTAVDESFDTLPETVVDTDVPVVELGPVFEGTSNNRTTLVVKYDEAVQLAVLVSLNDDLSGAFEVPASSRNTSHRVNLTNLDPDTQYHVGLRAEDEAGNQAPIRTAIVTTARTPDLVPPAIDVFVAQDVTTDRFRVEARLNEPAAMDLLVSQSSAALEERAAKAAVATQVDESVKTVRVFDRQRSHKVNVSNLMDRTTYFYQAVFTDASNNRSVSSMRSVATLGVEVVEPPEITNGPFNGHIDHNSATISFRTDRPTDSRLRFYPRGQSDQDRNVTLGDQVTEHQVFIANLVANTDYDYEVYGLDAQRLQTPKRTGSLKTTGAADIQGPIIDGPVVATDIKTDRVQISWMTNELADTQVRYTPAGGGTQVVTDPADVIDHRAVLPDLIPGTLYTYQAYTTDRADNGPTVSNARTFTTLPLEQTDDIDPEFTKRPIVTDRTPAEIRFAFSASEPVISTVEYGLTLSYEAGRVTSSSRTVDHDVRVGRLQPGEIYFFRIRIRDAADNDAYFPEDLDPNIRAKRAEEGEGFTVETPETEDVEAPVLLTGPIALATTAGGTVVEWSTDETADGAVVFYAGGDTIRAFDAEFRRSHRHVLSGLELGTTYTYLVESKDPRGNGPSASPVSTFTTLVDEDVIAPAITAGPLALDVVEDRATITWTTDESATTELDYGTSTAYGTHLERGELVQLHKITLTDLAPGTTYHFKITSRDLADNVVTTDPEGVELFSRDQTFSTLPAQDSTPPLFTNTPTVEWTNSTAGVRWTTDELASSRVDWAGGEVQDFVEDNTLQRDHSLTLTGLQARTSYRFRVSSVDAAGNEAFWGDPDLTALPPEATKAAAGAAKPLKPLQPPGGAGSFVTSNFPDTQLPIIIGGPQIREKTANTLTIEWQTDELADSFVRFGDQDQSERLVGSAQDVVLHQVTLTNLQPGQQYNYVVESTDPSGNGVTRSLAGLATTALELDLVPPRFIDEPSWVARTDASIVLTWSTDEAATARVDYWVDGGPVLTRQVDERLTDQQVALTNLRANTEYFLRVFATDASQNETQAPIDLRIDTDPGPDLSPPRITGGPEVVSIGDKSVVIEWQTDELADSFIDYDTTPYLGRVVGDPEDELAHRVVLTKLTPGTRYHYRVGSFDRSGNGPTESGVLSFTTLLVPDRQVPPVPGGVEVVPGLAVNLLEWTPSNAEDLAGYTVYREEEGVFAALATNITDTSYLDEGLENGRLYRYRVTASDQQVPPNESEPSAIVEGRPAAGQVPTAPVVAGLEPGVISGLPIVVLENARAAQSEAELTYTIQISTRADFSDVVARGGNIAEGAGGLTRWRVPRFLFSSTTYWFRARAFDGRFEGEWSEPAALRPDQAQPLAVTLDFDGDGAVSFSDFFLLSYGYGSDDPALDVNRDGGVSAADIGLISRAFGQGSPSKPSSVRDYQVAEGTELAVEAHAITADEVVVRVRLKGINRLAGYGFTLSYDPFALRYQALVDSAGRPLGEPHLGLRLVDGQGDRVSVAQHVQGHLEAEKLAPDGLIRLLFKVGDRRLQAPIRFEEGYISQSRGDILRIGHLGESRILPTTYALYQNYPNPFNPSTTIVFAIPSAGAGPRPDRGLLVLYNTLGQVVRRWDLSQLAPGFHTLSWDGADQQGHPAASGIYLLRMEMGRFRQTRKLTLLR